MRALVLDIAGEVHAVPLASAREIVTAPFVAPLVTAPPAILGLFNLRGEIVPLLDAGLLLSGIPSGPPAFAVVVETAAGPGAVLTRVAPVTADVTGEIPLLDVERLFVLARGGDGS